MNYSHSKMCFLASKAMKNSGIVRFVYLLTYTVLCDDKQTIMKYKTPMKIGWFISRSYPSNIYDAH